MPPSPDTRTQPHEYSDRENQLTAVNITTAWIEKHKPEFKANLGFAEILATRIPNTNLYAVHVAVKSDKGIYHLLKFKVNPDPKAKSIEHTGTTRPGS